MTECYRDLILNSNIPVVFHESLNWEILKWSLQDWCNVFQKKLFPFRCGRRSCQKIPFWESLCQTEFHTMDDLIKFCSLEENIKNKWWYFDYKHINEHFSNDLFETLSWSGVGFPEKSARCSTIWIGSPGANTPCHFDTYGCNVVAQVFGRKRWLLFPPTETKNLKPTRVPYEESSVYSNINFSCFEQFKDEKFENIYIIDLYPGDVLLVPPKWWHYVENMSLAISINTWIPREEDDISRVEEALVRYFISSVIVTLPNDIKQVLLNPNELDIENNTKIIDVLNFCKNKSKQIVAEDEISLPIGSVYENIYHNHNYKLIPKLTGHNINEDFFQLFACHRDHSKENYENTNTLDSNLKSIISVINVFCHPDIIRDIKSKFLQE